MSGPTAWQQTVTADVIGNQSITTTAETVIATLAGVNSRSVGANIKLLGTVSYAIDAAATSVTLRIRPNSISGTALATTLVEAATAATLTDATGVIVAEDVFAGEYCNKTYVLTIAAAAAAGNWNVLNASLRLTQ
jgi:hypothetical protein